MKILENWLLTERVCVILGTRPGIVKMSPVIRALKKERVDFFVIHSGQHYSYSMDKQFFEDLKLPSPQYHLNTVRRYHSHGGQTAEMLKGIEKILIRERPRIVLVGGDANTNLSGALAARKLRLIVGHLEAGLRSLDWRMPEEHNRVMIDHISELLFAPTEKARKNLLNESVRGQIWVVGNTIVDAVKQNLRIALESRSLADWNVSKDSYYLLTMHREENLDDHRNLNEFINLLGNLDDVSSFPILFPMHPRTRETFVHNRLMTKLLQMKNLRILNPLGYLDFLVLLSGCKLVLTDSGGVQEEACILHVPCLTLRENTERPETVEVGANLVVGLDPKKVIPAFRRCEDLKREWTNPFGNGTAGVKVSRILRGVLDGTVVTPLIR